MIDRSGKWHVCIGSLPTENLPEKSIDTPKPTARRVLNYQQDVTLPEIICYETLNDIQKDLKHVKCPWLVIPDIEQKLLIGKLSDSLDFTSKIIVDEKLCVTICWFGVQLPSTHFLYENNGRYLIKKQIQWLIKEIDKLNVCRGITEESLISFGSLPTGKQPKSTKKFYLHVSPKSVILNQCQTPIVYEQCVGSTSCDFLSKFDICKPCLKVESLLKQKQKRQQHTMNKPLSLNAPLHAVAKKKLMQAVKLGRAKQRALEEKITIIEVKIKNESVNLQSNIHKDLKQIIDENVQALDKDSFECLFWEEQLKAFNRNPLANRWLPMMIRFALYLHLRSPSPYQALKES